MWKESQKNLDVETVYLQMSKQILSISNKQYDKYT